MSIAVIDWVLKHSEATLGCRLVLIAMADTAHDDGSKTFQAVETIAAKSRMSRRAVQAALRKLEAEGHIEATGRTRGGTVVYTIRGVVSSPPADRGEADDRGGEVRAARGEVDDRTSGVASSPRTFNRQGTVRGTNGVMPEPMGFEEWLAAHCELTGQTPPGVETKARAELARKYGVLTGEGRSLDDMRLASLGAYSDRWRRENAKDFPRNVLVSDQVDELIEKGRRAEQKAPRPRMERTKDVDPWDEEL